MCMRILQAYVEVFVRRGILYVSITVYLYVNIYMHLSLSLYLYIHIYVYIHRKRDTHAHTHTHTRCDPSPKKGTLMKLPDDSLESGALFLCFLSSNDFPPVLN